MLSAEGLKDSNEDWVAIVILHFSVVATVIFHHADSDHEVTTKLLLKHNLTHAHSGTIDNYTTYIIYIVYCASESICQSFEGNPSYGNHQPAV